VVLAHLDDDLERVAEVLGGYELGHDELHLLLSLISILTVGRTRSNCGNGLW